MRNAEHVLTPRPSAPTLIMPSRLRSHLTLVLCTIVHAFTHAYGCMLVPLYLIMVREWHLPGVRRASLIVTVYGAVYFLGGWHAGKLADRHNRKAILGISLLGNGLAIAGIAMTHSYAGVIALAVVAGLFGALFHPAANALMPAHYPKSPGMAIGFLGIGSGLGFSLGPIYAGWRAQTAQWHWLGISDWQRPCLELGLAGAVMALVFLLLGSEAGARAGILSGTMPHLPLGPKVRRRVAFTALVLGCRDFAGSAAFSLVSVLLLKAHGVDSMRTGAILGQTWLVAVITNPLSTWISPGRRRLPTLVALMIGAGLVVSTTWMWSISGVAVMLLIFQGLHSASYAVSDASICERVRNEFRGRVAGLFLVVAGGFGAMAPWVMGAWTDRLGDSSKIASAYWPLFATLAGMFMVATISARLIARLRYVVGPQAAAEGGSPQLERYDTRSGMRRISIFWGQ